MLRCRGGGAVCGEAYKQIFGEAAEEGQSEKSFCEIGVVHSFLAHAFAFLVEEEVQGLSPVHEGEAVELHFEVAAALGEDH